MDIAREVFPFISSHISIFSATHTLLYAFAEYSLDTIKAAGIASEERHVLKI